MPRVHDDYLRRSGDEICQLEGVDRQPVVIDSITAILAYLQAPSGRSPWTPPCHTAHSSVSLLLVSAQGTSLERSMIEELVYRRQTSKCGRWIATCVPSGATHRMLRKLNHHACAVATSSNLCLSSNTFPD